MKYAFIRAHSEAHAVVRLCDLLNVSTSGYYDWRDRPQSNRSRENRELTGKIYSFHQRSNGLYGSPKIHKDLLADGERCGVNRVARLMRASQLQSKLTPQFVATTDSKNTRTPAPDLLRRDFTYSKPNEAWVTDTTFIPTRKGWLYLATVLDLYSRKVIGWAMNKKNDSELVYKALLMALWRRGFPCNTIVHSDQGSTYASAKYQDLLQRHSLVCSMSRKGDCFDNAVAESFFGSLKNEQVYHDDYMNHDQAKQSIFKYIEVFYNRQRRHAYLDYVSPADYEAQAGVN